MDDPVEALANEVRAIRASLDELVQLLKARSPRARKKMVTVSAHPGAEALLTWAGQNESRLRSSRSYASQADFGTMTDRRLCVTKSIAQRFINLDEASAMGWLDEEPGRAHLRRVRIGGQQASMVCIRLGHPDIATNLSRGPLMAFKVMVAGREIARVERRELVTFEEVEAAPVAVELARALDRWPPFRVLSDRIAISPDRVDLAIARQWVAMGWAIPRPQRRSPVSRIKLDGELFDCIYLQISHPEVDALWKSSRHFDPDIQFREAWIWVHQNGAKLWKTGHLDVHNLRVDEWLTGALTRAVPSLDLEQWSARGYLTGRTIHLDNSELERIGGARHSPGPRRFQGVSP